MNLGPIHIHTLYPYSDSNSRINNGVLTKPDIGICFEDLVTHFPLSSQTFWTFASVVRAAAVLHSRSASPEC